VSLLTSPGHYELTVPVDAVIELLSSAIRNIVEMGVPAVDVPRPTVDGTRLLSSRREQLIRSAARAFRRRGFAGVALDDLTADVGVVGPALYRYFDSKADLLAAITSRFNEWDALESTRALAVAGSESEALDLLIRGYIQIALDATDALACMLTESLYLPEKVANRVHRMRSDSLGEWIDWLMKLRQELTEGTAQVLCNAARTIVDDLVRIPHLRSDGRLAGELHGAVMATFYARSSLTPPRESTAST
jgi:AcrR family transcriptional regulator